MVLRDDIKSELIQLAKKYELPELILFGSRARGDCWERSDIDIAAEFRDVVQYFDFCADTEKIETLLIFDVVDLNSDIIPHDLRKVVVEEGLELFSSNSLTKESDSLNIELKFGELFVLCCEILKDYLFIWIGISDATICSFRDIITIASDAGLLDKVTWLNILRDVNEFHKYQQQTSCYNNRIRKSYLGEIIKLLQKIENEQFVPEIDGFKGWSDVKEKCRIETR